ncbi:MAG: hypothetical protein GY953_45295, partial [bacterium]|nr:hypothetical protein [bacterium]
NGPARRVDGTPFGGRSRGRSAAVAGAADDGAVDHLAPARDGAVGGACSNVDPSARTRADGASTGSRRDADVGGSVDAEYAGRDGGGVGQLETAVPPPALRIEEGTVFSAYRVQKAIVRGSQAHPANVVESTAMASVEPPDVTYRHHLPAEVIAEGRISDLQLEDVIYAGQATGTPLPD